MKSTIPVLALLLVSSCFGIWPRGFLFIDPSPPTAFTTRCGLKVINDDRNTPPPPGWTLAAVQEVEDRALQAFKTIDDPRFLDGCRRLEGWELMILPGKNISAIPPQVGPDGGLLLVGGNTDCGMARIWVGNSAPMLGRLAHELGHAVQGCQALSVPGDCTREDLSHCGWSPIFRALEAEGFAHE